MPLNKDIHSLSNAKQLFGRKRPKFGEIEFTDNKNASSLGTVLELRQMSCHFLLMFFAGSPKKCPKYSVKGFRSTAIPVRIFLDILDISSRIFKATNQHTTVCVWDRSRSKMCHVPFVLRSSVHWGVGAPARATKTKRRWKNYDRQQIFCARALSPPEKHGGISFIKQKAQKYQNID